MEWDMALLKHSTGNTMTTMFPSAIGSSLLDRGYNRAKFTVTAEGILVVPYKSDQEGRPKGPAVELPEWGK